MKAWQIDSLSGIAGLQLRDVPEPHAEAGRAVIDVLYAALNPADRYLAEGQYPARPAFPHTLGRDAIGTVLEVGPDAGGVKAGDRVIVLRGQTGVTAPGTFAGRVSVPVHDLLPPPPGWDDTEAAGATLVYLTAYQALTQFGPLKEKGVVLVTGASGGVGVATVQLGAAMGHTVVGFSRDEAKRARLEAMGARTLDPADTQWRRRLKEMLGGKKADLAVDNVGGDQFGELIDALGQDGRVSVVGRLAGPVPQFNTASLFFRRIWVGGVAVGTYTNADARAAWAEVVRLLNQQNARPLVDRVFKFEDLPAAFDRLQQGPMGKVLLAVGKVNAEG